MKTLLKILALGNLVVGIIVVSWGLQWGWYLIGFAVLFLILGTS